MESSDLFQMLSSSASSPGFTTTQLQAQMGFQVCLLRRYGDSIGSIVKETWLICAVCLDGVHKGERSRNFSICKHVFHARCIGLWLVRRLTCPTCRSPFKMEPV